MSILNGDIQNIKVQLLSEVKSVRIFAYIKPRTNENITH